jgi:hypothetical protein
MRTLDGPVVEATRGEGAPRVLTARAQTLTPRAPVDSGPGRLEPRRLTARPAVGGDHDGSGLAQVVQLERPVPLKTSGAQRHDVVAGVTSLGPAPVRGLVRQPWQSEHHRLGGRAGTGEAARSHGRCGSLPQVRAAVRNSARGVMRGAGETNIAAAGRIEPRRRGRREP